MRYFVSDRSVINSVANTGELLWTDQDWDNVRWEHTEWNPSEDPEYNQEELL